ncbi:MAG: hypothetical protein ACRCZS_19570 [Chroococcidiopsis sp.]
MIGLLLQLKVRGIDALIGYLLQWLSWFVSTAIIKTIAKLVLAQFNFVNSTAGDRSAANSISFQVAMLFVTSR